MPRRTPAQTEEKKDRRLPTTRYNPEYKKGLTSQQVQEHRLHGWINRSVEPPSKTTKEIIHENVFTYFNLIFAILAVLLILVGAFRDLTFLPVIIANTLIGIVQEVRAKQVLDKLTMLNAPHATVVRDGKKSVIDAEDLVIDDIVIFKAGNQVCADAVVSAGEVQVNESLLTGESDEITKRRGDKLMSGSFIVSGQCHARLDRVGEDSYISKLTLQAKQMQSGEQSEMIRSLNKLVKCVGVAIIPIGLVLFAQAFFFQHDGFRDSVTSMIAAVIGMIPEGLYLLTSVALTASMLRLARRRAMVKNMYCIEMLARVDVLCLDKTGTITDGSMSVKKVIEIKGGSGGFAVGDIIGSMLSATEDNNQTALALADKFGYNLKFRPLTVLPFSSDRKLSAVTFEEMGTYMLGAPEYVLSDMGIRIKRLVDENASQGYRVMCLAHSPADIKNNKLPSLRRPICLIVIEDHIREDAADTIKWFRDNDVAVKVISGDNPITVAEVARRVGVENADKYISLEGLSNQEVMEAASRYTVFGRVTPEQKSILVRSMKSKGHTVAMTGDGVNDILAMRQADCALSVASGAEAARNVAHLVLMDNNFTSMPDVVVEGRRVINNIAKASSLYLMKTIMTVLLSVIALILKKPYFFTTEQTLMYELFITAVPSLFLALQINKDRVQGRFLGNMLKSAAPGGITLTMAVMAIYIYWATVYSGGIDQSAADYATYYDQIFKTMVTITLTYTGYMGSVTPTLLSVLRMSQKFPVSLFAPSLMNISDLSRYIPLGW